MLQQRSRLERVIARQEQFESSIADAKVLFEFAEEVADAAAAAAGTGKAGGSGADRAGAGEVVPMSTAGRFGYGPEEFDHAEHGLMGVRASRKAVAH